METLLRVLRRFPAIGGRGVLVALILAPCLVEAVLLGADYRLWGTVLWRGQAYQYGGFWAGLLHGWRPNYMLQPMTMFASYSLLHTGLGHLVGNMLCMAYLGDMVLERGARLIRLYVVSALGGALAFGVLSTSPAPMIGASGVIFGLAGALTVWDAKARRAAGKRSRSVPILLGLTALNGGMWWLQSGNLAWETHLGGFVAGAIFALYPRRVAKMRS